MLQNGTGQNYCWNCRMNLSFLVILPHAQWVEMVLLADVILKRGKNISKIKGVGSSLINRNWYPKSFKSSLYFNLRGLIPKWIGIQMTMYLLILLVARFGLFYPMKAVIGSSICGDLRSWWGSWWKMKISWQVQSCWFYIWK